MNNGPLHTKFRVLRHVISSAAAAKLGALFNNIQTTIPMHTSIKELGHQQLTTTIDTKNSTALGNVKSTVRKSKAMDKRFYWVKYWTLKGHLFIYWGTGKTNTSDYFTKHHPPGHYTVMRHEYLHKYNHSLIFVPPQVFINHILGLTSPKMIY